MDDIQESVNHMLGLTDELAQSMAETKKQHQIELLKMRDIADHWIEVADERGCRIEDLRQQVVDTTATLAEAIEARNKAYIDLNDERWKTRRLTAELNTVKAIGYDYLMAQMEGKESEENG